MTKWVIGLSVDEEISLGAERYDGTKTPIDRLPEVYELFLASDEASKPRNLESDLIKFIRNLSRKKFFQEIFSDTDAIGISTIGLADRKNFRLKSLPRKKWAEGKVENQDCVIDFRSIFRADVFGKVWHQENVKSPYVAMNIHNDATAKCYAEYRHLEANGDHVKTLFRINVSEGVNGGLVEDGSPFATELHPEIGHIWPRLHPLDSRFDPKESGCPIHIECFEGVASGARVRKSWGTNDLKELGWAYPDNGAHPWHRIAYYVAQLCMDATLAVSPGRIVLGGSVIFPELIPVIKRYFEYFNSGGTRSSVGIRKGYVEYDRLDPKDFIQGSQLKGDGGLRGAIELAKLAVDRPVKAGLRSSDVTSLADKGVGKLPAGKA